VADEDDVRQVADRVRDLPCVIRDRSFRVAQLEVGRPYLVTRLS